MKFAVVISSLVATVYAQTIDTPGSVLACAFHEVTFSGGTAPYTVLVMPGRSTHLDPIPLQTFSDVQCSPFNWFVEQAAGTEVFLRLKDIVGGDATSAPFTIQPGTSNRTCTLPASTPTIACRASTATASSSDSSSGPDASNTSTGAGFSNQVGIAGAAVGFIAAGFAAFA